MNATTVAVDLAKSDIRPVRVKSIEQQALQGLHRIRSLWMGTRTSRINALRGFCREFGIAIPVGVRTGIEVVSRVLADPHTAVPDLIRVTARLLVGEIRLLEARIAQVERELAQAARLSPSCTTLMSVPGIGLLTATHNKATCALANKLARICYATLCDEKQSLTKKINRQAFAMPI